MLFQSSDKIAFRKVHRSLTYLEFEGRALSIGQARPFRESSGGGK